MAAMTEEIALLRQYSQERSQQAFAELVRRYVDLVYSCARRQLGDETAAEDVTQAVFLLLAQKASQVPTDRPLSAWLVKAAGYYAANARRGRDRREIHVRRASEMTPVEQRPDSSPDWEKLSPLLDRGISRLPREDRDALLLRYFEKRSMRQVGAALGVTEDAAQKRIARAVDKLREFFVGNGVTTMTAVALAALLTERAITAAPAGLAASVLSAAGAAAPAAAGAVPVQSVVAVALSNKFKVAAAVALVMALVIGGGVAMSAARANKPRLVKPSTPTAAAATRDPKWLVRFSDGTTVDLIALSDPVSPQRWWAVDGSPTLDPQFQSSRSISMKYRTAKPLDLVLRMTGSALNSKTLIIRSDEPARSALLATGNAREELARVIIPVPRNTLSGKLRIGLANGPWNGELNLPGSDPAEGSTGAGVVFKAIREKGGKTLLEVEVPELEIGVPEDRQVFVTAGGKELRASGELSSGTHFTYTFRCKRSAVTSIIARSRPFQWIEMTNVAFAPSAERTAVAVVSRPAP
jgi:RNA polymerase sigma factor (sigma-70 family)